MSLIVLESVSLSFGGQQILGEMSLHIGEGERIGLVGPNGTGKSTLLRVLHGTQTVDEGVVRQTKHCRTAYLPQDVLEVPESTILGAVLESIPGRAEISDRLAQTEVALQATEDPAVQEKLLGRLAALHGDLDHFDEHFSEHHARAILSGLGFRDGDMERSVAEFSGGWRMRAALAGLLFQRPDVLLLDEPTNHLDVPTVTWLSEFMKSLATSLVLICHDREFFNQHVVRVVSFEPEGVRQYRGNYDAYLKLRGEEERLLEAAARNRQRKIKELERFVERFRAKATKARQAQSRVKQLAKMEAEIAAPLVEPRKISFRFPETARSGKDALTLDKVAKHYASQTVLSDLSVRVQAGERIAIIGPNGVGKTTLLKMIAGEIKPDGGEIRFGSNVHLGYYAQHQAELLNRYETVVRETWKVAPQLSETKVRSVCGAFLFTSDNVEKVVGVLSGGERARVSLIRLILNPGNLLVLDEPTNHLDIHTTDALIAALSAYDGTVIFASHNIGFVNQLATKVWDIVDGKVVEYHGNLADYFRQCKQGATAAVSPAPGQVSTGSVTGIDDADDLDAKRGETAEERRQRKRDEAERRNTLGRKTKTLRTNLAVTEEEIATREAEQQELETMLADPELHRQKGPYREALKRFEDNKHRLGKLYWRWEDWQKQLDKILREDEQVTAGR